MAQEHYSNIIDKIKKLFALSKSNNSNEAALALDRAKRMMDKYNIETQDLSDESISDILEIDFQLSSKFNTPALNLAYHIGSSFNIKPILIRTNTGYHKTDKKIKFIGNKSDLAVGTYIFSYIMSMCERSSIDYFESIRATKEKWSPLGAKKVKNDYQFGFIQAVCNKLKTIGTSNQENKYEEDITNAIMVIKNKAIDDYMKNNFKTTKYHTTKTSYDVTHYSNGFVKGEHQGIYAGIKTNIEPTHYIE